MTSTDNAHTSARCERPRGAARTYTWAGTDRRGAAGQGRTVLAPEQTAAKVEYHYRHGWRELRVAEGWDLSPQAAELAVAIDHDPGTGKRRWQAVTSVGPEPSIPQPDQHLEAGS
jgi:hypothetical protein